MTNSSPSQNKNTRAIPGSVLLSIGISVTQKEAAVHLVFRQDETAFTSEMPPDMAQNLALKLLEAAADARAMKSFLDLLVNDDLGADKLPLGTVRKILHAMNIRRDAAIADARLGTKIDTSA